ncbi:MAG: hypothetical protein ACFCVC_20015 [Acidimicrobiia bacterium]
MPESPLLIIHLAFTLVMVGFIWTIQLVQYPIMARVPAEGFIAFERAHQRRVVGFLALFGVAEVVTAGWLFVAPGGLPRLPLGVAGALLAVIWVSTGLFFAPLHGRLAQGFDASLHRRLVAANWLRTALWTARGVVVLSLVWS